MALCCPLRAIHAVAAPDRVPVELAVELSRQEEGQATGQIAAQLVDVPENIADGVIFVSLRRRGLEIEHLPRGGDELGVGTEEIGDVDPEAPAEDQPVAFPPCPPRWLALISGASDLDTLVVLLAQGGIDLEVIVRIVQPGGVHWKISRRVPARRRRLVLAGIRLTRPGPPAADISLRGCRLPHGYQLFGQKIRISGTSARRYQANGRRVAAEQVDESFHRQPGRGERDREADKRNNRSPADSRPQLPASS